MAALSTPKAIFETLCPEQVGKMISKGADVNQADQFGYTALMWAASHGNSEIAKLLVSGKADVNAQRRSGSTALMRAASKGNADITKLLVDNKADTKLTNGRGQTAADLAKAGKHDGALGILDPGSAKQANVASW